MRTRSPAATFTAMRSWIAILGLFLLPTISSAQTILFTEDFESTNLAAKGWYDDNANQAFSTVEHVPGSTRSMQFRWNQGETNARNGSDTGMSGAVRHDISTSGSATLYVAFDVKFGTASVPWRGSGSVAVHPHIMYILSNVDNGFGPLAGNYLNFYVEAGDVFPVSGGDARPRLLIQDNLRINPSLLVPPAGSSPSSLGTSVNHSVAGWNGHQDQATPTLIDTYGGGTNNYTNWDAASRVFKNNTWHRVEVYAAMNSLSGTIPQANGIIRYWVDGVLVIERTNVYLRTNQHPTMTFKTLVLSPYIGSGSPIAQEMWIDNLTVATGSIVPGSPQNLRVR